MKTYQIVRKGTNTYLIHRENLLVLKRISRTVGKGKQARRYVGEIFFCPSSKNILVAQVIVRLNSSEVAAWVKEIKS